MALAEVIFMITVFNYLFEYKYVSESIQIKNFQKFN